MIRFEDVRLARGGRDVLTGVSFAVHAGYKVGITGRNGSGKTSLLELAIGTLAPDAGSVSRPPGQRLAHVTQEMVDARGAALDYVLDGDGELRTLERELARAERDDDGERQGELHARLEAVGAYQAPARAAAILHGLGFAPGEERRALGELSGGWRMRAHLARALMSRSDVLALDEPTNHLDLDAVIWLEEWLRGFTGTLLLISHDRDFLDPLVDHVAHVQGATVRLYAGNLSAFEQRRAAELGEQRAAHARQQREIRRMRAFVDRFRAKASKARQAQSRLKTLARMEIIAPAHVDSPFRFAFPAPARLPRPLVKLGDAAGGYGDIRVLEGVDLGLEPGDRLALLGANGAGKSTLVKLLAGELAPLAGERHADPSLEIGYFAQHRVDNLRPDDSPLAHLTRVDPDAGEQALRDFLGGFDFSGERVLEPAARLSGGEQARLALALIARARPNLLLLDEPTNHLDMDMRHALAIALQTYEGAVVLVSHDRFLLRAVADALWLVDAGAVRPFDGDLDDYADWLRARRRAGGAREQRRGVSDPARVRRRADAERRRRLQP
ncbi:MAG: ATP-binding cassette domain-containing protein, partial [Gammaproteobacteria bacterium]|nr:ATP-binding cassette domain-containing protein [Gammaproteobacteria bacterium]